MIPATSIAFQDDGTAWLVGNVIAPHYDPWRAYDRSCGTCGGNGLIQFPRMEWSGERNRCPDCINGRHTFTIDVEYPGGSRREAHHIFTGWSQGVRSLRVSIVPGMVLPILTMSAACADNAPSGKFIIHGCPPIARSVLVRHPDDDHETVLDPFPSDAKPGGWAVKLRMM